MLCVFAHKPLTLLAGFFGVTYFHIGFSNVHYVLTMHNCPKYSPLSSSKASDIPADNLIIYTVRVTVSYAASYGLEGSVIEESSHPEDKGQRRERRPLLTGF